MFVTKKQRTQKLTKLMRGIDLCMMTTIGKGGRLHARPMSNNGEVEFDGDAWFFSWRDSAKIKEIAKDPRVQLGYTGGTQRAPVWISVTGTAKIVDDVAKKQELWLDELEQWFEDGPEDEDVVLIHVRAKHAHWWSYKEEDEIAL